MSLSCSQIASLSLNVWPILNSVCIGMVFMPLFILCQEIQAFILITLCKDEILSDAN